MAVTSNPLIGKTKQKLGGVVFTSWKGINVIKEKPLTVANPRSPGQTTQRNRLSTVVAVFRLISAAIDLGFKELAIKKSPYNAYTSQNIINGTTVNSPTDVEINPLTFKVSDGSLGTTVMTTVIADVSDLEIQTTFPTTTPLSGQAATDIPHCVIWNATTDEWEYLGGVATRAAGAADFPITIDLTALDECKVFVFFVSADGNKSSVSTMNAVAAQA